MTNEPTPHQVAGFSQRSLKSEVESRNQNEWVLDNVDGFYERSRSGGCPLQAVSCPWFVVGLSIAAAIPAAESGESWRPAVQRGVGSETRAQQRANAGGVGDPRPTAGQRGRGRRPAPNSGPTGGGVGDPRPTAGQDWARSGTRAQQGARTRQGQKPAPDRGVVVDDSGWSKAIFGGDRTDRTDWRSTIEAGRSRFRG